MNYVLGIDLGGTHVRVMAFTPAGEALADEREDTDVDWGEKIRATVRTMQEKFGSLPQSAGLGAPGLAARDGRSVAWMPGRFTGLEGLDWTQYLGLPVRVLNDAHAALMGEVWQGAARGCRNVVLLTLGTGVGGAVMCDGQLLRGHLGRAGHLGHICLDPTGPPDICNVPGSLEDLVGNCTIKERSGGRFQTTHELVRAYRDGDPDAADIWLCAIQNLACGLTSIINVVDPEIIVLGGGIAQAGAALFEPLQRELDRVEWRPGGHRVQLKPAELGERAGAFGAAWFAMKENVT